MIHRNYVITLSSMLIMNSPCFTQTQELLPIDALDSSIKSKPKVQSRFNYRYLITGAASLTSLGVSFFYLNNAWYKDFKRVPLHSFDDSKEWLNMDKMGHVWTAYEGSDKLFKAWRWAGANKPNSILFASLTSLGYLTIIEYLDGRSAKWGWSWSDMAANFVGIGTFVVQQSMKDNQAVQIKFSTHSDRYAPELRSRIKELFGESLPNKLLKDYNAQTYWMSVNMKTFFSKSGIPDWFNVAIGIGGEGMLGGFENKAYDADGNLVFDRSDIKRYRQWYFSFDVDLSKLKTKSKILRTAFDVLNVLKVPFPTLEFSKGKFKSHLVYF